jgi:uncharacterized protein (DUF58 family)
MTRVPLTGTGWAALLGGGALLALADLTAYVELAIAGTACLVAVVLALVWVRRPPALDVQRTIDPLRVEIGGEARARLEITNTAGRMSLPLAGRDPVERGWRGTASAAVAVPRLGPGATAEVSHPLPTSQRAVLRVGPLRVVRQDPFGLVRVEQVRGEVTSAFVHPATVELDPLPATFERSLDGPTSDTAPHGNQAFHQLREYVPGDDRRMIHWRSSARTGTLMVRQHVDTSEPDLTVVLDTRAARWAGDDAAFEVAVEVAASLVVTCARRGFPVRLRTTDGQHWDAPFGQPAVTYFLDRLAGVAPVDRTGLTLGGVEAAFGAQARGYAAAVVTGQSVPDDLRGLAPLVGKYDSVTLIDTRPGTASISDPVTAVRRINARSTAEFADRWNGRGRP